MKNLPTVIVTGSSGLVGSSLVSYFSGLGFKVRAFQRSAPKRKLESVEFYPFDLNDVQDNGFVGADYLIHCAYRPIISKKERESGNNVDLEGTKKIIALARKHGVKLIFLSSTSAHSDALSFYAKNKLQMEGLFDTEKDLVLKLGLVIGEGGGLFGRIVASLNNFKLVPLVGGGRQHIQTLALDDLCRIIETAIKKNITGKFMIAHPAVVTMEEIYRRTADHIGAKPLFIPVPTNITHQSLKIIEQLGLTLPFTAENVLGLKDMGTFDTAPGLDVFGLELKDFQTTLNQLNFCKVLNHGK